MYLVGLFCNGGASVTIGSNTDSKETINATTWWNECVSFMIFPPSWSVHFVVVNLIADIPWIPEEYKGLIIQFISTRDMALSELQFYQFNPVCPWMWQD